MTDDDRREDLRALYTIAVEEYRFQVQLNNQRFQWNVALDVALLTIGTGLLRLGDEAAGGTLLTFLVFVVGAALAAATAMSHARQVDYQHRARSQATKIAAELGLSEYAVESTLGWVGKKRRWPPKARSVNYALLGLLGVVQVVGAIYTVAT